VAIHVFRAKIKEILGNKTGSEDIMVEDNSKTVMAKDKEEVPGILGPTAQDLIAIQF
jgi:hypothetical protein